MRSAPGLGGEGGRGSPNEDLHILKHDKNHEINLIKEIILKPIIKSN